jgi:hypothetical protein
MWVLLGKKRIHMARGICHVMGEVHFGHAFIITPVVRKRLRDKNGVKKERGQKRLLRLVGGAPNTLLLEY